MAFWRSKARGQVLFGLIACAASGFGIASDHNRGNAVPHGVTVVQAEDVVRLAREHSNLIIIDSRSPVDRKIGYIEDSIALPDNLTTCETLFSRSKSLSRPLVFYCNGVKCMRSQYALHQASACGYTQLYWFKGGYEEWREKGLPVLGGY